MKAFTLMALLGSSTAVRLNDEPDYPWGSPYTSMEQQAQRKELEEAKFMALNVDLKQYLQKIEDAK